MTTPTADRSPDLPCHRCGYDLRAHPPDGKCPECGESVAESRRIAAIPRRPDWRDSDPRWRRRMLAGVWILVLLPLMEVLKASGWASSAPVPAVFNYWSAVRTLDDTLASDLYVYEPLVFCVGVVLLFSKERGRRAGRLDWTRRWGLLCSYVVLLLSAVQVLVLCALVLAGIAALFMSMPPQYQPEVTQLFVDVSTAYLRYGPNPETLSILALNAFSSIAILLACAPLFDALRSTGPKQVAAIVLAPLALFSLLSLAHAGRYCLGLSSMTMLDVYYGIYFRPQLLGMYITGAPNFWFGSVSALSAFIEATKWLIILAIAVWLSIAQLSAWRQAKGRSEPPPTPTPPSGSA